MTLRISGNRPLKTLGGQNTRPTLARVREAVFNIWQGKITDCRWLDLCAGTGSMGAEALCHGAAFVLGIEKSGRACRIIQQNWEQIAQPEQHFQVMRADVITQLGKLTTEPFDQIYFDPPYDSDLYQPVLSAIVQHHLLATTGEIAVEHRPNQTPDPIAGLEICRQKVYGNTALTFYRKEGKRLSCKRQEVRDKSLS